MHTINRLETDFCFTNNKISYELTKICNIYYAEYIKPTLESVLSSYDLSIDIVIPSLVIELGEIKKDDIPFVLQDKLRKSLTNILLSINNNTKVDTCSPIYYSAKEYNFFSLINYMLNGILDLNITSKKLTLRELVKDCIDILRANEVKWPLILSASSHSTEALLRLVEHLSDEELITFFHAANDEKIRLLYDYKKLETIIISIILSETKNKTIDKIISLCKKYAFFLGSSNHYFNEASKKENKANKKGFPSNPLEYLIEKPITKDKILVTDYYLQTYFNIEDILNTKCNNENYTTIPNIKPLQLGHKLNETEHFNNITKTSENKTEISNNKVNKLQNIAEKATSESGFIKIDNFLTDDIQDNLKKYYASLFTNNTIMQIQIEDAGIVLLHPFLIAYLRRLNLIDEHNVFYSKDKCFRAVQILKMLACGTQCNYSDDSLIIEKIICGVPLATHIDKHFKPTKNEISETEALLKSVISYWDPFKGTSIHALREAFIMRKGIINNEGDSWIVKVDSKSIDLLLDTIPWGISHIVLPWSSIVVNWQK